MIEKTFELHIGDSTPPVVIDCTEGDTMWEWHFRLFFEGARWTIPSGSTILFTGLKPDDNVFDISGRLRSNEAVITSNEQITAVAGKVHCVVRVLDTNGKIIASCPVILHCKPNPQSMGTISESVLSAYEDVLQELGDAVGVRQNVTDWLEEHITQPSSPVVDTSLSVSGAAADSKVVGDKAHWYRGFIGSGTLANYQSNGWYYIYPEGNFTDAPTTITNICFLHVWRSTQHVIQELYVYPYTVWRRDIIINGATGNWYTTLDRKTITANDDANAIYTPGVYSVISNDVPSGLPTSDEGVLVVFTTSSLATQMYVTIDGRVYFRRTGRDWKAYANPYVSWSDRIAAFVGAMNDKAKKIGMTNTTFLRPSGEGTENVTTPNDMLKCCLYANTYPIRRFAGVESTTIKVNGQDLSLTRNTDYDILKPDYIPVWGKTGSIPSAESPINNNYRTLMCVAYHKASKRTLAGVIMLAKSETGRFLAMKELFDATIRVLDGSTETVTLENALCGASCEVFDGCPNVVPIVQVNADTVSCPASMTKVMTTMVGLDCCLNLSQEYNMRQYNVDRGGNLSTNDRVSLDDLYTDMMIMSINSAAYQIADVCGEFYHIIRSGGTPV